MPPESVAHIASEMAPDDRADLFSVLPEAIGDAALRDASRRSTRRPPQEVREIEKWPETSAGHLMTTDYVARRARMRPSPRRSTRCARAPASATSSSTTSTRSTDGKLAGIASLRDLLVAEPTQGSPRSCARTSSASCRRWTRRRSRARWRSTTSTSCPSSTRTGKLLGVITIDDIIDVLTQEQTEDVQKIGAIEPLDVPYFQTSFVTFIKKRAGWLIILFVEEFFTQTALRHYDPVMEAVKGALLYVPLLISAGRQLRLAVVDARHPRPGARRDQADGLVAHPDARAGDGHRARAHHRGHRASGACSCTPTSTDPLRAHRRR